MNGRMSSAPKASVGGQDAAARAHTAMIKRRIRHEVSPDAFKPRPIRALTALTLAAAIATMGIILVTVPLPGAVSLLLSAVSGCMYGSLFFLGHEAGHGAVIRQKRGQDVLMWLAFLIFLLSPTLWRVWHNKVHHTYTNREDYDPDNFGTESSYNEARSVRLMAGFTPGSGRWRSLIYLPTWFTVHSQVVLWVQSRRCSGFESLDRRRAAAESVGMAAFWIWLAAHVGVGPSIFVIVIPMMVANAIIMSYIVTNHLLRPLLDHSDPLRSSMSLTTHPWMDLMHFNFSHHVEHHLFPSMSSRYTPLVRAKLREYAGESFFAPSHVAALLLVFRTPRIHDQDDALVDPTRDRRIPFSEISDALVAATAVALTRTRGEVRYEPEA